MIKHQKDEARSKKQVEDMNKKVKARQQMQEKLAREDAERHDYEASVSKMEQEEQQLIQRLKNT